MSTYNLNQTELYSVLGGSFISAQSQSPQTIGAVISALQNSGNYPTGSLLLPADIENDSGTVNAYLGDDFVGFFLELGSNTTVDIQNSPASGAVEWPRGMATMLP